MDMPLLCLAEDFRLGVALSRCYGCSAGVTVDVHEPQGTEPVEPGVGHVLDNGIF